MTVKDKESALHGNSVVQDLREWPKANIRTVKLMAKRFFQTFFFPTLLPIHCVCWEVHPESQTSQVF